MALTATNFWTLSIEHYLKVQKLYTTRKTVLLPSSVITVEGHL
jgi:hypothetical protein